MRDKDKDRDQVLLAKLEEEVEKLRRAISTIIANKHPILCFNQSTINGINHTIK
jgi:hypothetical protein